MPTFALDTSCVIHAFQQQAVAALDAESWAGREAPKEAAVSAIAPAWPRQAATVARPMPAGHLKAPSGLQSSRPMAGSSGPVQRFG